MSLFHPYLFLRSGPWAHVPGAVTAPRRSRPSSVFTDCDPISPTDTHSAPQTACEAQQVRRRLSEQQCPLERGPTSPQRGQEMACLTLSINSRVPRSKVNMGRKEGRSIEITLPLLILGAQLPPAPCPVFHARYFGPTCICALTSPFPVRKVV